jgi:hypothetical protein
MHALACSLLGCYHTVGPVVADAYLDDRGVLHTIRCNLTVGSIGDDQLLACRDEAGKYVDVPVLKVGHP